MAKKRKAPRQEWNPNFLVRVLQFLWDAAWGVLKIAFGAAGTVIVIAAICCFVLIGTLGDYLQEDVVPNVTFDLNNYDLDQTSFIYYVDHDGKIQRQQKIYADTDRQWASYEEIPEDLIHAAIAIEDKRFYEHQGVDWITTVKACANMFFGNSSSFGGSTITQQLIKNLTEEDSITVQRKVQEIFRAQKFESQYDKEVVLEWYLNTIYLGQGCSGVKSAARAYFGKELEDLTTAECASLISITNNPSLYDPYLRPGNNRERQLTVLDQMLVQEWITQEEYDEAVAQEMVFTNKSSEEIEEHKCPGCGFTGEAKKFTLKDDKFYCPECGAAQEFELDSSSDMYSWHTELVMDDVAKALAEMMGMEWNSTTKKTCMAMIKKGGYHIYSTLDTEIQQIVDDVYTNLENIPTTRSAQKPQSAIVVIDNRTGDIVALAGRVGEKVSYDSFSFAYDGGLQTGSVMKPLTVYAPAFEAGAISPASVIPDAPLTSDGGDFPLNESRYYSGSKIVMDGVTASLNTTAVHVLDRIGLTYSFDFAKNKFRLEGLLEKEIASSGKELSDIGYAPLGLGGLTYGVTVRDMASAYATFPNGGTWRDDRTFTKVYDSEGNLIIDNTQESEKILSDKANNYMNYCLRGVVTQGTGYYAALDSTAVAAKTGTTSNNQDRWFIGYTAYYTAAVWFGYEQPEEVILTGSGINPALRLWKQVMEKIHRGKSWREVHNTDGMYYVDVCLDSGKLATDACRADPRGDRVSSARVYYGDAPSASCDRHVEVKWCKTGDGVANEFCEQVKDVKFTTVGLLRCTSYEILHDFEYSHLKDNCIYLVDGKGNDAEFHGINGGKNKTVKAPYLVCTKHTKDSVKPPETEPTEPSTEPSTDPTAPTVTPPETTPPVTTPPVTEPPETTPPTETTVPAETTAPAG